MLVHVFLWSDYTIAYPAQSWSFFTSFSSRRISHARVWFVIDVFNLGILSTLRPSYRTTLRQTTLSNRIVSIPNQVVLPYVIIGLSLEALKSLNISSI